MRIGQLVRKWRLTALAAAGLVAMLASPAAAGNACKDVIDERNCIPAGSTNIRCCQYAVVNDDWDLRWMPCHCEKWYDAYGYLYLWGGPTDTSNQTCVFQQDECC